MITKPAPLIDLSQYASSLSLRSHCYAELAVSSPAVALLVAATHEGIARLHAPRVNTGMVDPPITNPDTNRARGRVMQDGLKGKTPPSYQHSNKQK